MIFNNVGILGLAHVEANNSVTSLEIEKRLSVNMERFNIKTNFIENLSGIKERKFWDKSTEPSPSYGATKAAIRAIEDSGIDKSKIDLLINTSVSRDFIEPATSTIIQNNLGLKNECLNFDISNACLGFLNGLDVAANMIENKAINYALVVNGESLGDVVERTISLLSSEECTEEEFRNGFSTLTLGSGAVAMVLCRKDLHPESHSIVGKVDLSNLELNNLCQWKDKYMVTKASGMLKGGVKLAVDTYQKALKELEWDKKEIQHYVPHQVGIGYLKKFSEITGVPLEKMLITFNEFGNMGPVSLPFTLSKYYTEGIFKKNDRVALYGFGSGINCLIMEVIW
jgi:3-oxoacyl-[acyl-carrier-protein] synthase III